MDKVVLLINKTSNQRSGKQNLKPSYLLFTLFGVLTTSCSFMPMQKAGSEALAEAICVYEKKINRKSDAFDKCLIDRAR